MPETENQAVMNSREKLQALMAEKYPDKKFGVQSAENAESDSPADDLENSVLEYIAGLEQQIADNKAKNDELVRIVDTDPKAGPFLQRWVESGDPRSALVEVFGDDLASLATEEGRGQFQEQLAGWREKKAAEEKLNEESEANWTRTLETLDAWGNAKGLTDEQKSQIILRLIDIAVGGMTNSYQEKDFEMAYKDSEFDNAVSAAKKEGEIIGRNESIKAARRERSATGALPPSLGGGQGMRIPADKPKPVDNNPWHGLE